MKFNIKILVLLLGLIISFDAYACHEDDYIALRALYLSTDGDNWYDNTNWPNSTFFEMNPNIPAGTDVDTWYGVGTDTDGCVDCIDMDGSENCDWDGYPCPSGNNLTGSIPSELGDLTNLKFLTLGANNLSGSIPPEIGDLTNLEELILQNNQLGGSIPPEIGDLSNLIELNLGQNQLIGEIPHEILYLTNLQVLYLGAASTYEGFIGSIFPELGNLTNLEELNLCYNGLTGNIPVELGNLTNLEELNLCCNGLTGNIPAELGNLGSLSVLSLNDNQLSGCYDPNLLNLCNQLIPYSLNEYISEDNNFDATWEDFCATEVGACEVIDIDNTHQSTFTVYPIPAKDFIVFDVPNIAAADEIILYDITGREISRQAFPQDKRLVVSHLNDGVYIYRIFYEEEVYSGKIVVE